MEENVVIYQEHNGLTDVKYYDEYNEYPATSKRKYTFIHRSKGQLLICQYCRKEFKYPSKYKEHLRIHTGERPFKCSQCPLTFTQSGARKAHERLHSEGNTHVCEVCGRIFRTKGLLQKHLRFHDPPTFIEPQTLYDNQNMQQNQQYYISDSVKIENGQEQHSIPAYDIVEYGFIEPDEVEATHRWQVDHIPSVSQNGLPEQDSELQLTRLADGRLLVNDEVIEGHYVDEGLTIYTIQLSNGQLMNFLYDEANDSLEIVEPNEESTVVEPPLLDVYPSTSNHELIEEYNELQIFDDLANTDNNYVDPYSPTADDLLAEKRMDIKPVPELLKPPLTIGDVVLADSRPPKTGLSIQDAPLVPVDEKLVKLAAPVKEYTSGRKRIKYKKPDNLEWIINAVATGKKIDDATPYNRKKPTIKVCEYCGLTLKYPSKIEAHMRTHTGEKPFECDICHQRFALRTTLRMHLRRHLKQKMYACTVENCKKTFICAALLRHHIKIKHTTRSKYACLKGCGLSFFSNKEREKHEETCMVMDLENPICELPIQEEIIFEDKYYCFDEGEQQYVEQWNEGIDLFQQTF